MMMRQLDVQACRKPNTSMSIRRGRLSFSFFVLVALDVLALASVVVVRAPDGTFSF